MRREWEPEDLIACWTLVDVDWKLVANKRGATRLGFALLLKCFELEARLPQHSGGSGGGGQLCRQPGEGAQGLLPGKQCMPGPADQGRGSSPASRSARSGSGSGSMRSIISPARRSWRRG
ncbi:MAG TPA: hypothetical protein VIO13_13100 [Candidatus Dormibacteraeota bacterium]